MWLDVENIFYYLGRIMEMDRKYFLKLLTVAPFALKLPAAEEENSAAGLEDIFNQVAEKSKAIPGPDVSAIERKWKQLNVYTAAVQWHRVLLEKCDAIVAQDLSKITLTTYTIRRMMPLLKTINNPALDAAGAAIQEKWKVSFAKVNKLQNSFSKKRVNVKSHWQIIDTWKWVTFGRSRSNLLASRLQHISNAQASNKEFSVFLASVQEIIEVFLNDTRSNFQTVMEQMGNAKVLPANTVQLDQQARFLEQVKTLRDMKIREVRYSGEERKQKISEFEKISARPEISFTKELMNSLSAAEQKAVLQKLSEWHVDLKAHGSINDTLISFGFGLEKISDKVNESLVKKRLQELKDQVKLYQKHVIPFIIKYGNSIDQSDVESTLKIYSGIIFNLENDYSGARALREFSRSRRVFETGLRNLGKSDMDLWELYGRLNDTEIGYMSIRKELAYFENLGTDDLLMKKPVERGNYSIKTCMQVSAEILDRLISEQRFKIEFDPNSREARKSQEDIATMEKNWLSRYSSMSVA